MEYKLFCIFHYTTFLLLEIFNTYSHLPQCYNSIWSTTSAYLTKYVSSHEGASDIFQQAFVLWRALYTAVLELCSFHCIAVENRFRKSAFQKVPTLVSFSIASVGSHFHFNNFWKYSSLSYIRFPAKPIPTSVTTYMCSELFFSK